MLVYLLIEADCSLISSYPVYALARTSLQVVEIYVSIGEYSRIPNCESMETSVTPCDAVVFMLLNNPKSMEKLDC